MLVDDCQDFLLFFGLDFDGCQSLPDAAVGANGAHPFDSRKGCGFMVGCAAKRAHSGNFGRYDRKSNLLLRLLRYAGDLLYTGIFRWRIHRKIKMQCQMFGIAK